MIYYGNYILNPWIKALLWILLLIYVVLLVHGIYVLSVEKSSNKWSEVVSPLFWIGILMYQLLNRRSKKFFVELHDTYVKWSMALFTKEESLLWQEIKKLKLDSAGITFFRESSFNKRIELKNFFRSEDQQAIITEVVRLAEAKHIEVLQ